MADIVKILFYIIAFIGVLFAAYYSCRFLSSARCGLLKSKHMSVLDRLALSRDKSLVIVKVGGRFMLISISGEGVSLISELGEEDVPAQKEEEQAVPSFGDLIKRAARRLGREDGYEN